MKDRTITWNPVFGAVKYLIDLTNTNTGQSFHYETTATSFTFTSVPSGTYDLVVKAEMGDGSTSIIIEELVDL